MVFDLICPPITSHKKDFLMNTKEWGVLSFLVGILMAGLFQEIPSSMFALVVVPVFCTLRHHTIVLAQSLCISSAMVVAIGKGRWGGGGGVESLRYRKKRGPEMVSISF